MSEPGQAQKLQALDQALLFLSSLAGAVSAAVLLSQGSPTGPATFLVFIVLTTAFPLYVGYMRGAVELDSVFERVRGWIYLIFGGGSVALTIGLRALNVTPLPPLPNNIILDVGAILGLALGLILAFLFAYLLLLIFIVRFIDWTYEKVAGYAAPSTDLSGFTGIIGALFLASLGFVIFASLGTGFNTAPITDELVGRLATLLGAPLFIFPLFYVEFNCRRLSALQLAAEGFDRGLSDGKVPDDLAGWRRGFVFMLFRLQGWGRVERRDSKLIPREILAAFLLVVGDLLVPSSSVLGLLLMVVADFLVYYFFWVYVKETWAKVDADVGAEGKSRTSTQEALPGVECFNSF